MHTAQHTAPFIYIYIDLYTFDVHIAMINLHTSNNEISMRG